MRGRAKDLAFAYEASRTIDLPVYGPYVVVAADNRVGTEGRARDACAELATAGMRLAWQVRGETLVGLIALGDAELDIALTRLRGKLDSPAGLSFAVRGLAEADTGFQQATLARRTLDVGRAEVVALEQRLPEALLLGSPDLAARLTAITEAAGANLVGQLTSAHKLTRIGVLNARRALAMLRDDEPPGPASLPGLVSETAAALGIPISFEVDGVPRPLDPEAGLMLYRVVQEALTNVAKHAGRGVRVTVRLAWAADGVEVSVVDSGGDGTEVGLPSGGFGLTCMTERAGLRGGRLNTGRSDDGFAVRLWLPAS